ncbi:hypothetical protein E2C01_082226 [Portunus trituberculatus]|uniref:Uncharacterized protein n=1 Tax=Portunus trituberculatus TaxID=210409 RepID=A0A5B7IXX0_PORTR|nr:hypothetical protein [Portunus trituberculatus]
MSRFEAPLPQFGVEKVIFPRRFLVISGARTSAPRLVLMLRRRGLSLVNTRMKGRIKRGGIVIGAANGKVKGVLVCLGDGEMGSEECV